MLVYNLVKDRLFSCGFSYLELDWTINMGVVAFKKGHINVFLKPYDENIKATDILNDAIEVRKHLEKNPEINIWNSYILICPKASGKVYTELVMKVEKDTTALRKYLIYEEKDVNRIPFLDNTDSESVKPKRISDEGYQGIEEIRVLVNLVQELTLQEGGKISPKKLKNMLEENFLEGV